MLCSIRRSQYLFLIQSLLFSTVACNETPARPAEGHASPMVSKGGGGYGYFLESHNANHEVPPCSTS